MHPCGQIRTVLDWRRSPSGRPLRWLPTLVDTARMRECEGCGGEIASVRVVCPDGGTAAPTPATLSAAPLAAAAQGTSGAGAPWEHVAPPVAAAGLAPVPL